jgi:hypothetical protein
MVSGAQLANFAANVTKMKAAIHFGGLPEESPDIPV